MIKRVYMVVIKKRIIILSAACFFACIGLIYFFINYFNSNVQATLSQKTSNYIIFAGNDLGMHCYQSSYAAFLILPPGNNLKVQVFRSDGEDAELVNSGIEVSYQIINNTTSANKIDFWEYAKDYGFDVAPNIGITGNGLSGKMVLSADGMYYEATAIPVTPFNDSSTELNPYQMAVIRVSDSKTGQELAKASDVVVPVSNEMDCYICHGSVDTDLNILKAHDERSNTQLVADLANQKRYKCSDCHRDNILSAPGKEGILPLSQAMHGFHADKMTRSDVKPECYSCHPGPVTQCYRGRMYVAGVSCVNSQCHGDMANIAKTQSEGRQAWLQEPNCSNCHGDKYAVNPGQLYRNSYLINNADAKMNGFILCQSCHNSPHAEWQSANSKDNLVPIRLQGTADFINKCTVCHEGTGKIHQTAPR